MFHKFYSRRFSVEGVLSCQMYQSGIMSNPVIWCAHITLIDVQCFGGHRDQSVEVPSKLCDGGIYMWTGITFFSVLT